jgi:hypothetical protein
MKTSLYVVGLSFLALTSACGKSASETFIDGYCAEFATCCGKAGLPADGKQCRQLMSAMTMGGGYNASAGDACLAEMRAASAAGTFCDGTSTSSPACDSVFQSGSRGHKQPGESCEMDNDCATSDEGKVSCESTYLNGAFIDKCQVRLVGKAGDAPCVGTQDGNVFWGYTAQDATDVVPRGYVCDLAQGIRCEAGTCKALLGAGDPCSNTSQCAADLYCDYALDQCAPRAAIGGTCAGSGSDTCVATAYCDSARKQCAAKVANGEACTTSAMCLSDTCSNLVCKSSGLADFGLTLLCGGS